MPRESEKFKKNYHARSKFLIGFNFSFLKQIP